MSIGSAIGSSIGRSIGSAIAGGGGFSVLSLSPLAWWKPGDFTTAFQDSAGTTPVTAAGQTIGLLTDKSGNSKSALQATPANEPLLTDDLGIRQADTTDVIVATLTTGGTAYINTPVGWYRSNAPATTYRLPLCNATETIVTPPLTGAQETALAAYFGTAEKYMVAVSTDTTISNLRIYTGGATTALLFVGANGATVSKNLSLNSNASYDVSADGLTAPVAVAWPASLITSTALTHFYCNTNQLTGSIPSLSANTALTQFYCNSNQLTGSIPSLSANTALTQFICNSNQLTGSIPSLSANTALQFFYCYSNQLTGSIPSLSANTALTTFQCYSNQLTGSIPSLSANTALTTFQCNTNQLTGYTGGGVSITLGDFQAHNNLLTQAAVDAILADFVAANKTTGTRVLNLGGTGNATPSATGLSDKATLVSRGWTVTTN